MPCDNDKHVAVLAVLIDAILPPLFSGVGTSLIQAEREHEVSIDAVRLLPKVSGMLQMAAETHHA